MPRIALIWNRRAKRDLQRIQGFIERESPRNAARFIRQLRNKAENLRRFPEIGGRLEDIEAPPEVREVYQGKYRIIYHFSGRTVVILAVRHGAKTLDLTDLLE